MKLAYTGCTPDGEPAPRLRGMLDDPAECFATLRHLGYAGVQLSIADPRAALEHAGELREAARACGLEIVSVCTDPLATQGGCSLITRDEELLEASRVSFGEAIRLGGELECPVTLGLARGMAPDGENEKLLLGRAIGVVIFGLLVQCLEQGTSLLVKPIASPEMNWLCDVTSTWRAAVRANHPCCRMTLDSAYLDATDAATVEAITKALSFVKQVELAEPNLAPPGAGGYDFPALFRAMDASSFRGWCIVSPVAEDHAEAARMAGARIAEALTP